MGAVGSKCLQCGTDGHAFAQCPGAVCEDCGLVCVQSEDKSVNQRFVDEHKAAVHLKEKKIECPVKSSGGPCRKPDRRFKDWSAATAHVEMGGCGFGRQRAQEHIYQFVKHNSPEFLNRQIEYKPTQGQQRPENKAYACNLCNRTFNMLFSLTAHAQAVHSQTYRFNAERNMIKTEQNATNPPSHHLAPPVVTASPPFTNTGNVPANTAEPVEKNNNKVQPKEQNDDDSNTAFQYETEYNLQNRKFVKKVQIVEVVEI